MRTDADTSQLDLWDSYQVCTFSSSAATVGPGATIRLAGQVPGAGYATIYERHTAAAQPETLSATGWTRIGSSHIGSTGKFLSASLHPTRTTWYMAKYTGWVFPAFTSVVKVTVH